MSDPKTTTPKPPPADIKIEVVNPRYEGATLAMVGRALLRSPPKSKAKDRGQPDRFEPAPGGWLK